MQRKSQSTDDIIITIPIIDVTGVNATTLSSLASAIINPAGSAELDYTEAVFSQPNSDGTYVCKFPSTANSLVFTAVNTANPYAVTISDPTSGIEPSVMEIWLTDRYPWELSKETDMSSISAEVSSINIELNTMDSRVSSVGAEVSSNAYTLTVIDTEVGSVQAFVNSTHNIVTTYIDDTISTKASQNSVNSLDVRVESISAQITDVQADLDNPSQYMADVSALAGQSSVNSVFAQVQSTFDSVGSLDTKVSSIGVEVGNNFTALSSLTPSTIADQIWDEILNGAEHNISASAGKRLRELEEAQGYGGIIHINVNSGSAGTAYPKGTLKDPVDNMTDAKVIADANLIKSYEIHGSISVNADHIDWRFKGEGTHESIDINSYNVDHAVFETFTVKGVNRGYIKCAHCNIESMSNLNGVFYDTGLNYDSTVVLSGSPVFHLCYSVTPGDAYPRLDFQGQAASASFRGQAGGIGVKNYSQSVNNMTIELIAGKVILETTVTDGVINLRGVGEYVNSSNGATINTDGFIGGSNIGSLDVRVQSLDTMTSSIDIEVGSNATAISLLSLGGGTDPASIAQAVWSQSQSSYVSSGTFGYYLDARISAGGGTSVDSLDVRVQSLDVRVQSVATEISSNATAISSIDCTVKITETIDLVGIQEGYPRIEINDTYQFTKNIGTAANSAEVSIFAPDGSTVASKQTATQSGTSANYYHYHTVTNSFYTTVDSSGMHTIEWTFYRATGNDKETDYFEVIKTD